MKKPEVARAYIRVSHVGERNMVSDLAQLEEGKRLALRKGWTLDEEASLRHKDLDQSGFSKSWKKRPGLKGLLKDAESGQFTRLIVYRLDRLGRHLADGLECLQAFREKGVEIATIEGDFDPSNGRDAWMMNSLLNNAQLESANTSERLRGIVRYRAETGRPHGGQLPCWLEYKGDYTQGAKREVVVNERVADAIRRAVTLRQEGYGLGEITQMLNEEGYIALRGGRWHYATIRRLLMPDWLDTMVGYAYIHRPGRSRVNPITRKKEPYGDPICVGLAYPPIIDTETADQLKAIYADRSRRRDSVRGLRTRERSNGSYLLTSITFCTHCGERLIAKKYPQSRARRCDKDLRAYTCYSTMGWLGKGIPHTRKHVSAEMIEDAVLRVCRFVLEQLPQVEKKKRETRRDRKFERNISDVNTDIDRLLPLLLQPSESGFRVADLQRRYDALVAERERLAKVESAPEVDIDLAMEVVKGKQLTRQNLRMIIHALCERVEYPVFVDGVETTCNHPGGTKHHPRPCVRVILRYELNGVGVLLAPCLQPRSKAKHRIVIPETQSTSAIDESIG